MALTPQQLEDYRQSLIARRAELARDTVRAEAAAADQSDLEHADLMDRAAADVAKDDALHEASRESEQLVQVEEALHAIAHGTYGVCSRCGQEIPKARLDAVPWATLCIADQEIADQRRRESLARENSLLTGGAPSRAAA
jgi:DnaK suppressor protein